MQLSAYDTGSDNIWRAKEKTNKRGNEQNIKQTIVQKHMSPKIFLAKILPALAMGC